MNTTYVSEAAERRDRRALAVSYVGPLVSAGGIVWAILQPYRVTLLHPRGQGFWWLVAEPPLYVVLVGVLFRLLLAPGIVADLLPAEESET
jgi:hypothetical protein